MGGKQRIAPQLAAHMQPYVDKASAYVEPFVGSAAMMCKIKHERRIGSDINEALISMWKALADGWEPPLSLTQEMYYDIKKRNDLTDPLTCFAAIGCSFSGKWWGGYARNARGDNYTKSAVNSIKKKMETLENVEWSHLDYQSLTIPLNSVIYCDPPYIGTTEYGVKTKFDYSKFYTFCREKSKDNTVFISEYVMPDDFEAVLEVPTKTSMRTADGNVGPRIEKLWRYRGT